MAATAVSAGWAYAVPLDETNGYAPPHRTTTSKSQDARRPSGARSRSTSRRRPSDYAIMSDSEASGSRRASIRASNSQATRKRSRNALREMREEKLAAMVDDSAWIHRDKLAQIEIQEMEAAGIHVRQSRRSMSAGPAQGARTSRSQSRAGARRNTIEDRQAEVAEQDMQAPAYTSFDDYRRVSTIPAADEEEKAFDPELDYEIRTPEEIAAEEMRQKQHMIRPGTSRIPVSKASPVPVPQMVVGRDSPLPRSRNGSGAFGSGGWDDMQYAKRARSGSVGSQVLLDDGEAMQQSRPASSSLRNSDESSQPKPRVPSKGTPTSGGRKSAASTNGVRPGSSHHKAPRAASSVTKHRPTSSSGHKKRLSTGQMSPEGEAPWLANMYKPDPRLPQDQQMLPTHAKRMMQEQWEKDGTTGTAYDRDLNLLNDEQFKEMPQRTTPVLQLDGNSKWKLEQPNHKLSPALSNVSTGSQKNNQSWPLSPTKSDTPSRPGTSGGYKITPTITTPPAVQRTLSNHPDNANGAPHNPTPRVPDYDEKDVPEPKKGCCCVMM